MLLKVWDSGIVEKTHAEARSTQSFFAKECYTHHGVGNI